MGGARHPADGSVPVMRGRMHRADAATKLVVTLAVVAAVVATPVHAVWAFGAHALVIGLLVTAARIPLATFVRRLVIEVPFVLFAIAMPFVGPAPRTRVLGLALSTAGLWSGWGIVAKGTLGVAASVVLAATTPAADVIDGLRRLRVPALLVAVLGFMVRYGEVVTDEMERMRVARASRGADPRWLWQSRAIATSAGALFVRSYERGERVHLAMLARGFDGAMPDLGGVRPPAPRRVLAAAVTVTAAWSVAITAMVLT